MGHCRCIRYVDLKYATYSRVSEAHFGQQQCITARCDPLWKIMIPVVKM